MNRALTRAGLVAWAGVWVAVACVGEPAATDAAVPRAPWFSDPIPLAPRTTEATTVPVPLRLDDGADRTVTLRPEGHGTFQLATTSVGRRGGTPPVVTSIFERTAEGTLARRVGPAREVWRERAPNVEQSWEFERIPDGAGDLVVEVETGTEVRNAPSGVSWGDGPAKIQYSHATWIDGAGAETPVRAVAAGTRIRLVVPESVVSEATYPAVLDPTLSASVLLWPAPPEFDAYAWPTGLVWANDHWEAAFHPAGTAGGLARIGPTGELLGPTLVPESDMGWPVTLVRGSGQTLAIAGDRTRRLADDGTWLDPAPVLRPLTIRTCAFVGGLYHCIVTTGDRDPHTYARIDQSGTWLDTVPVPLILPGNATVGRLVATADSLLLPIVTNQAHWVVGLRPGGSVVTAPWQLAANAEGMPPPDIATNGTSTLVAWKVANTTRAFVRPLTSTGAAAGPAIQDAAEDFEPTPVRGSQGWIVRLVPSGTGFMLLTGTPYGYQSSSAPDGVVTGGVVHRSDLAADGTLVSTGASFDAQAFAAAPSPTGIAVLVGGEGLPPSVTLLGAGASAPTTLATGFSRTAFPTGPLGVAWTGQRHLVAIGMVDPRPVGGAKLGTFVRAVDSTGVPGATLTTICPAGATFSAPLVATPDRTFFACRAADASWPAPFAVDALGGAPAALELFDPQQYGLYFNAAGPVGGLASVSLGFGAGNRAGLYRPNGSIAWPRPVSVEIQSNVLVVPEADGFDVVGDGTAATHFGLAADGTATTMAWSGGEIAVASDSTGHHLYARPGTFLTLVLTGPYGSDPIEVSANTSPGGTALRSAVWDGGAFLILALETADDRTYLRRVSTTGALGPVVRTPDDRLVEHSRLSSDGQGTVLVTGTRRRDRDHLSYASTFARLYSGYAPIGASCSTWDECGSGQCVDGFCCDQRCGDGANDCQACSIALGASANGRCTPVNAGQTCRASTSECDPSDTCDGLHTECVQIYRPEASICSGSTPCDPHRCRAGACTSEPVECPALDDCHPAGSCNAATGTCVAAPAFADGTACDDHDGCTRTDVCAAGRCVGSNPVTCAAPPACRLAGTCVPATGACAYPAGPDGATCDDASLCTSNDHCAAGNCVGTATVCPVPGVCWNPGTCNPTTGVCSAATKFGSTRTPRFCDDGNACTSGDTCGYLTGNCVGGPAVTCTASPDPCQRALCSPSSGCGFVAQFDGVSCNDGNACTPSDSCRSGICTGTGTTTCQPRMCQAVSCDPATGCAYTNVADGLPCNDGDACTLGESCVAGACTSGVTACPAPASCRVNTACDPVSGTCSTAPAPDGTSCDDSDPCTDHDTCTAGSCAGTPVTCPAPGTCRTNARCDRLTGACTSDPAIDGSPCNDADACTTQSACHSGTCVGSATATCAAPATCRQPGRCNASDGTCTYEVSPDGSSCDDGNPCTTGDSCASGTCRGMAVTCTPADACHVAGTCDPGTGRCTTPPAPDGTACDDANACTSADACRSGACAGTAKTCTASDACHRAGTCDPSTGTCSNPIATDGTACNDGNACTRSDACTSGTCAGTAISCGPPGACELPGTCNRATGRCTYPPRDDGTACDDENLCTHDDACLAGTCAGTTLTCPPADTCRTNPHCVPSTGACIADVSPDGAACSSADSCASGTRCLAGTCVTSSSRECPAPPVCHALGSCDPESGECAYDPLADGTACDDGSPCTTGDSCVSGACTGTAVTCAIHGPCEASAACDPATGACVVTAAEDGTTCDDGDACTNTDACLSGACTGFPRTCETSDPCKVAIGCEASTGACVFAAGNDGAPCNDRNACSILDHCQAGFCVPGGISPACEPLDAGTPVDAGPGHDAGTDFDAGPPPDDDAGEAPDATTDVDASEPPDAADSPDASEPADAADPFDAGETPDAADPGDASVPEDAGPTFDASNDGPDATSADPTDAGDDGPDGAGCGCGGGNPGAVLAAFALILRRRRNGLAGPGRRS